MLVFLRFATELLRLRARFFASFDWKLFLSSRLIAALALRRRAFLLSPVIDRRAELRAYAPRPLMEAMWVTPALRRKLPFFRGLLGPLTYE